MKALWIFLAMVPGVMALDITTLDGKAYKDCEVSRVFPDSICVLFSGGGARVQFTNLPEPVRLPNMEAVEKHFRETHKENIIKAAESHTLSGTAARSMGSPELGRLLRSVWEDQRRFPLQIATVLSQQFAGLGLQFFKVNKTVTHVCVARPHYLDMEATPVSEGVKRIVEFINANPKCNRRQLVEALAPSPPAPSVLPVGTPAGPVAPEQQAAEPTPEQTAVIADLHWLIHQGHVIEFASGRLETAKRPIPKPARPQVKPVAAPAPEATPEMEPAPEPAPESENLEDQVLAEPETAAAESPVSDPAQASTPDAAEESEPAPVESEPARVEPEPAPVESQS